MSVKSFLVKPVAWLTTASAVLAAVTTVTVTPPFAGHVPDAVTGVLGAVTVIVTAVLGVLTHNRVTPLAAPRDSLGRPLVPARGASGLPN
jgi:hypothetical protein